MRILHSRGKGESFGLFGEERYAQIAAPHRHAVERGGVALRRAERNISDSLITYPTL